MNTRHLTIAAAIAALILCEAPQALAQTPNPPNSSQVSAYNGAGAHGLYPAYGQNNAAFGYCAMYNGYTGSLNTAVGTIALAALTTGTQNVAVGYAALYVNNSAYNTAVGSTALQSATGSGNTAVGAGAGYGVVAGIYNIALGYQAGASITNGNYNIDIGHAGLASDSGIIRIGTPGYQTATYISGAVRIKQSGDLSMGAFTNGPQPQ